MRILLYFQLHLPKKFTDRNETYGILKSYWGFTKFWGVGIKNVKNIVFTDCAINSPKFGIHGNHDNMVRNFHNKQFDIYQSCIAF